MTALDLPDGALGGIVALYSIIHIPPERLPGVFAEFGRVLAPGGHLLLAFQVGDERRHLAEWFGHAVSLDGYRWPPDRVAEMLSQAGRTRPTAARARRGCGDDAAGLPAGPQAGRHPPIMMRTGSRAPRRWPRFSSPAAAVRPPRDMWCS